MPAAREVTERTVLFADPKAAMESNTSGGNALVRRSGVFDSRTTWPKAFHKPTVTRVPKSMAYSKSSAYVRQMVDRCTQMRKEQRDDTVRRLLSEIDEPIRISCKAGCW